MATKEYNDDRPATIPALIDGILYQKGIVPGGDPGVTTPELLRDLTIANAVKIINLLSELNTPSDNADGNGTGHRQDAKYLAIGKELTLSDPIIPSNATGTLYMYLHNSLGLIYAGIGAMFRANANSNPNQLVIENGIMFGDGTNTFADYQGGDSVALLKTDVINFADPGTLKVATSIKIDSSTFADNQAPLKVLDTQIIFFDSVAFVDSAPYARPQIELSGTFISGRFTNMQMLPIAGDAAFKIDSGIVGRVFMSGVNVLAAFGGVVFDATGLDQTDPRVSVFNCPGIPDSKISGEASQSTTTHTITIPLQNAYVISDATGWTVADEERITIASDGSFIYNNIEPSSIKIDRDMVLDQTPSTDLIGIREWYLPPTKFDVTFTNATNLINEIGHGLSNGDTVSFRNTDGTLPAELSIQGIYYVINANIDDFQIAYTSGGGAIIFTDDGTPTNNYQTIEAHGSEPSQNVTSGSPIVYSLKSEVTMETGGESVISVIHKGSTNDIRVYSGGYLRV